MKPNSYSEALKRLSKEVWPGCGDGRFRHCGRVHDYQRTTSDGKVVHDFRCAWNHQFGCPTPIPQPAKVRL